MAFVIFIFGHYSKILLLWLNCLNPCFGTKLFISPLRENFLKPVLIESFTCLPPFGPKKLLARGGWLMEERSVPSNAWWCMRNALPSTSERSAPHIALWHMKQGTSAGRKVWCEPQVVWSLGSIPRTLRGFSKEASAVMALKRFSDGKPET